MEGCGCVRAVKYFTWIPRVDKALQAMKDSLNQKEAFARFHDI